MQFVTLPPSDLSILAAHTEDLLVVIVIFPHRQQHLARWEYQSPHQSSLRAVQEEVSEVLASSLVLSRQVGFMMILLLLLLLLLLQLPPTAVILIVIIRKMIYAHNSTHDVTLFFSLVNASVKGRGKPTLQMVYSCDKRGELEQMTTAKTCSHGRTPNSTIAGGTTEKVWPILDTVHARCIT